MIHQFTRLLREHVWSVLSDVGRAGSSFYQINISDGEQSDRPAFETSEHCANIVFLVRKINAPGSSVGAVLQTEL